MSAGARARERWDRRHAGARTSPPRAPDAFVLAALERLPGSPGRALDLACGTGRHALLLAARGWQVEAWDFSPVALEVLQERAAAAGLAVTTRLVDLAAPEMAPPCPPPELVLLVSCCQPALLPRLAAWPAPGGHLLVAVATEDWPGERPPPRFRYPRDALRDGLPGLETVLHREEGGRAGLLARRPAVTPRL